MADEHPHIEDSRRNPANTSAGEDGPGRYEAGGIGVVCPHCRESLFDQHEAMLNTRVHTFFKVDWADRSGTALICLKCGLIQWFAEKPVRVPS
jgi:predicted nucleic-acid-binding Zn-ribbon protein